MVVGDDILFCKIYVKTFSRPTCVTRVNRVPLNALIKIKMKTRDPKKGLHKLLYKNKGQNMVQGVGTDAKEIICSPMTQPCSTGKPSPKYTIFDIKQMTHFVISKYRNGKNKLRSVYLPTSSAT